MSRVQFEEEEEERMRKVFHAGAPPLAPFLLKQRRKRDEIRAWSGRDLREHSCEQRGVIPQGVKGESLAHDIFAAKLKVS